MVRNLKLHLCQYVTGQEEEQMIEITDFGVDLWLRLLQIRKFSMLEIQGTVEYSHKLEVFLMVLI